MYFYTVEDFTLFAMSCTLNLFPRIIYSKAYMQLYLVARII